MATDESSVVFGDERLPGWLWRRAAVTEAGCWEWNGGRDRQGYGTRCNKRTHRAAMEALHGPLKPSQLVCHACDNPPCFNPAHLWIGTPKDNYHDAARKGRLMRTKCRRGHEMSGWNLQIIVRGGREQRRCKACRLHGRQISSSPWTTWLNWVTI